MDDVFVFHVSDEDLEGLAGPSGLVTNGCQCSLGSCTTQTKPRLSADPKGYCQSKTSGRELATRRNAV